MHRNKKTKIVATIGPASDSPEKIRELIEAGVNVFRFNMKHNTFDWHSDRILRVRQMAKKMKVVVGVLVDLQGPEIRLETKNQRTIEVKKGDEIAVGYSFNNHGADIKISHRSIFKILETGDFFLVDDGFVEFIVVEKGENYFVAQATNDGQLGHRKSINIPGKNTNLPSLIKDDLRKLSLAKKHDVDFIALSFSRTKRDIDILKREMSKRKIRAQIVAKVESRQAIENIDELIDSADIIMIARGDLGIEIPIEELAYRQKKIVRKCRKKHKPVITATQMLESMIRNPRPTRAEATDVANAVFDGVDAVMLSEETSIGKYPVKAAEAMARIAYFNEQKAMIRGIDSEPNGSTQLIVNAAMAMIGNQDKQLKISTAIVFSESGYTARVLSSFRPKIRIIAITNQPATVQFLSLSYGVTPLFVDEPIRSFKFYHEIIGRLKKEKLVKVGENALIIHGRHRGEQGLINSLALEKIK